jgi:hypothetical protein
MDTKLKIRHNYASITAIKFFFNGTAQKWEKRFSLKKPLDLRLKTIEPKKIFVKKKISVPFCRYLHTFVCLSLVISRAVFNLHKNGPFGAPM